MAYTKRFMKLYQKKWRLEHREHIRKENRDYYLAHIKQKRKRSKRWYIKHKSQYLKKCSGYRKSLKGKEVQRKHEAEKRKFGFFSLNRKFKGSAGHHINRWFVIYIPVKLHKSVYHSVLKNINITKINRLAFGFLCSLNK